GVLRREVSLFERIFLEVVELGRGRVTHVDDGKGTEVDGGDALSLGFDRTLAIDVLLKHLHRLVDRRSDELPGAVSYGGVTRSEGGVAVPLPEADDVYRRVLPAQHG